MSRQSLMEEFKLREYIQKIIRKVYQEHMAEETRLIHEEYALRDSIQSILSEVISEAAASEPAPHSNTGINVLEELLKKIIPIIEADYKTLTTSAEQRDSFRSHIINAIQNTLVPNRLTSNVASPDQQAQPPAAGKGEDKVKEMKAKSEEIKSSLEEEVQVNVGDEPKVEPGAEGEKDQTDPSAFIDIEDKNQDLFTIDNMDMTGRNMALKTYKKIEQNVIDSYGLLGDEEDKQLFYDYLIANIKLYCDRYEEELQSSVDEPTNSEYEDEKGQEAAEDKAVDSAPDAIG